LTELSDGHIIEGMGTERFPRQAVRKLERCEVFPLMALEGVGELRRYLDEVEAESIARAKALGATPEDIASHMGITRQGAHYKLKFSEQRLDRVQRRRQDLGGQGPEARTRARARSGDGDLDEGSIGSRDGEAASPR
jgi:hypothetical protein